MGSLVNNLSVKEGGLRSLGMLRTNYNHNSYAKHSIPSSIKRSVKKYKFLFFSKNLCLFINIYTVPFKVIPSYDTLVPALFPILEAHLISTFWYSFQLFQRCSFYLLNYSKSPSFRGSLQFWKQEKVAVGQVW